MEIRGSEFYKVVKAQTERFRKSAIPSMIKMLNPEKEKGYIQKVRCYASESCLN